MMRLSLAGIIEGAESVSIADRRDEQTSALKIAHVADSMEMGGAEKLTATFCRLQRDRGHAASVTACMELECLAKSYGPKDLKSFSTGHPDLSI